MQLTLGPKNLTTDLDFTPFKRIGKFFVVNNQIRSPEGFEVGVYTSGGLDSTALLCLVLSELTRLGDINRIPVTCFTINKSDGPTFYATQVVKKVEEHFATKLIHVNDLPNDADADVYGNIGLNAMKTISNYSQNMVIFMGINRMAPDEIRPFKQVLRVDYGTNKTTPLYTAPFLFLHKPQILDLYYKLGCENLIQYTHTCTELEHGACGKCYSCAERKWGFDALGKTDPGTIIL